MNSHSARSHPRLRRCTAYGLLAIVPLFAGCTLSVGPNDGRSAAVARENTTSTSMTLKRMLEAEDPQVRALVAKELGEIGPTAIDAVPTLHRLTEDPDRHVRLEAARALMRIDPNDRVAVPALVMIINDPVTTLDDRLAALTLLQQSGPKGQAALAMHNASGGGIQNGTRSVSPTTRPVRSTPTFTPSQPPRRNEIIEEEPIRATDMPAGSSSRFTPAEPLRAEPSESTGAANSPAVAAANGNDQDKTSVVITETQNNGVSPATQEIPGIIGLAAAASAPAPDIHLYGQRSYSSPQANRVRDWIEQQPGLSPAEKQSRIQEFHRWRMEQDRRISAQALDQ